MDLNYEKERLLDIIEILELYDEDEIEIEINNFELIIVKSSNNQNHNISFFFDVHVDPKYLEKYNSNSEIEITYTINDQEFSELYSNSENVYFDGGLLESEFTGNKKIKHTVHNIDLENIEEILIEIEAYLYEKNDEDIEITITFDQEKFENELQKLGFTKHD